jgi:hypothetical protein
LFSRADARLSIVHSTAHRLFLPYGPRKVGYVIPSTVADPFRDQRGYVRKVHRFYVQVGGGIQPMSDNIHAQFLGNRSQSQSLHGDGIGFLLDLAGEGFRQDSFAQVQRLAGQFKARVADDAVTFAQIAQESAAGEGPIMQIACIEHLLARTVIDMEIMGLYVSQQQPDFIQFLERRYTRTLFS